MTIRRPATSRHQRPCCPRIDERPLVFRDAMEHGGEQLCVSVKPGKPTMLPMCNQRQVRSLSRVQLLRKRINQIHNFFYLFYLFLFTCVVSTLALHTLFSFLIDNVTRVTTFRVKQCPVSRCPIRRCPCSPYISGIQG